MGLVKLFAGVDRIGQIFYGSVQDFSTRLCKLFAVVIRFGQTFCRSGFFLQEWTGLIKLSKGVCKISRRLLEWAGVVKLSVVVDGAGHTFC